MKYIIGFLTVLSFGVLAQMASAGALDKPGTTGATPPPAGGSLQTSSLTKAAPAVDGIVGRWNFGGTIWEFGADGKCNRSAPNFGEGGSWKILTTGSPAKYEVNWSGGRAIDTIYFSASQNKILSKAKNGKYNPIAERAVTH